MTRQDIIDVLGINEQNYTKKGIKSIISQFRKLNKTHDANSIWLVEDYPFYEETGVVVDSTEDLVAVE